MGSVAWRSLLINCFPNSAKVLTLPDWSISLNARLERAAQIRSSWGRWVSLAFIKVLDADLSDVLVRSMANSSVLLT